MALTAPMASDSCWMISNSSWISAFIPPAVDIAEEDRLEIEVSSFSQLWISSITLEDSLETPIMAVVRFSCALDTSTAMLAVCCAALLISSTDSIIEELICSTVATFVSRVRSMELICITASIVLVTACSNSFLPLTRRWWMWFNSPFAGLYSISANLETALIASFKPLFPDLILTRPFKNLQLFLYWN
ncbi:hypothetical protein IMSAGC019_03065 [Lachnospiraceae bacterium]|nr:hypothetical protein IMSAGC019_03065 [Lachnospiraceae bacterium]